MFLFKKSWFLVVGLIFLIACENDIKKVEEFTSEADTNVEIIKGIEVLYSDKGLVKVKIEAPKSIMHKTSDAYQEFPDGIRATFYNDSLEVVSELTANYAVRFLKKGKTEVRDSVVVISKKENKQMETEELFWDERKRHIYSTTLTKVTSPGSVIYAKGGFESNESFTKYELREVQNSDYSVDTKKVK